MNDPQNDDQGQEDPGTGPGEDKGSIPEGLRVVPKRKRHRGKRGSARQTLFLKKREILREMHDAEDKPVQVRQQPERLEEAPKPEPGSLEDRWGERQEQRRSLRWVFILVFAVLVPITAFVVAASLLKGSKSSGPARITDTGLNLDEVGTRNQGFDSTSPHAWFYDNAPEAFERAVDLLDSIDDGGELAPGTIRDEERVRALVSEHGMGWDSPFAVSDPRQVWWETGGAGDTGYLVIIGRHEKFQPFRAYFVNTERGMRLDWEATVTWSEVPVGELVATAPTSPVLVRGVIGKQPYFDSDSRRGRLLSWYQVLSPERDEFVWAYAPADSPLDRELKAMMNYGLIVLERKDEARATFRLVKPPSGFRDTEFELVELITEDWVMP